jgi:hypothetical protein
LREICNREIGREKKGKGEKRHRSKEKIEKKYKKT